MEAGDGFSAVWRESVSVAISVFGLGYVGSVTAACFARMGHRVVGIDMSQAKVEMLACGRSPIVAERDLISSVLNPDQIVIDLIHLDPSCWPEVTGSYEGICL